MLYLSCPYFFITRNQGLTSTRQECFWVTVSCIRHQPNGHLSSQRSSLGSSQPASSQHKMQIFFVIDVQNKGYLFRFCSLEESIFPICIKTLYTFWGSAYRQLRKAGKKVGALPSSIVTFAELEFCNQNNTHFLLYCPVQACGVISPSFTGSHERENAIQTLPNFRQPQNAGIFSNHCQAG